MAIGVVITRGYTPAITVGFIVTRGYSSGAAIISTGSVWSMKKRDQPGFGAKRGPGSGGAVA